MEFKLETVMENVLWNLLLDRESYINNIQCGDPIVYEDQLLAIKEEVVTNVKDYFIEDESIIVIVTHGGAPDIGDIKIYHMDNLTGKIELLDTRNIDESYKLIDNEYLSKRYHVHWFWRNEDDICDGILLAYDYANDESIKINEMWYEDPEGDPPM